MVVICTANFGEFLNNQCGNILDAFGEVREVEHLGLVGISTGLDVLGVDLHLCHVATTRLLKARL